MKCILIPTLMFVGIFRSSYCQTQFPLALAANYLQELNIKMAYFLTCWNKYETINLIQMLDARNVRFNFIRSITTFNQSVKEKDLTYYGYVLDLTCGAFNSSFLTSDQITMRMERPWLILLNNLSMSEVKRVFKTVNFRMDSKVTLAVLTSERTFKLLDIYNRGVQTGAKTTIVESGFWNGSSLIFNQNSTFYTQRKDMTNMQLKCGSVVVGKLSGTFEEYISDVRNKHVDTISKYFYQLFLELESVHNFTHSVLIEDKWFSAYKNGTEGGIGKLLYEKTIDLTCTGGSQRPHRVDVYDLLVASYVSRPLYVFRNPGSYDPFSNQFLKPFATTAWYSVIIIGTLICILLQIFHRCENKFIGSKSKPSWAAAILTTLAVIFQQDSSTVPTGYAGRITFLVLQILSVLLYNYYTSSIISSLLSKPPEAFHTLDDLGHSNLEIGIEDLPYAVAWFKTVNDSDVQYIYKNKVFPPGAKRLNIYTPEEGISRVGRGGFAYHTQLDTAYPLIAKTFGQDAICDIAEIKMITFEKLGIIIQKRSQYKKLFSVTLRRISEVGLDNRISQVWVSKKPECLSSVRVTAVGFNEVFMAFLVLFFGTVLALVLLVVEVIWFKLGLDSKFA